MIRNQAQERRLLKLHGEKASPGYDGLVLSQSADALLNGGQAPQVNGNDDEAALPAASGLIVSRLPPWCDSTRAMISGELPIKYKGPAFK